MGSVVAGSSASTHLTMALHTIAFACIMLVTTCLAAPLSEGNSESIQAYYGFYGNPIYRPYGFGSWGLDPRALATTPWCLAMVGITSQASRHLPRFTSIYYPIRQ